MSQFVIESGTKQYFVKQNDKINVDRLQYKVDEVIELPVLFTIGDGKATTVKAKVLAHIKGKKTRVVKYRNKQNYHKVTGFRPYLTTLEIIG